MVLFFISLNERRQLEDKHSLRRNFMINYFNEGMEKFTYSWHNKVSLYYNDIRFNEDGYSNKYN